MTDVPAAGRLVLMCGLAGSGKSTWARRLEDQGWLRFSVDRELWALGYVAADDVPADVAARIRARQQLEIEAALRAGRDVVVDWSHWSRAQRDEHRALGAACRAEVEVVHVRTPEPVLRRRLAARRGGEADDFTVSDRLLDQYLAGFEAPGPDETDVRVVAGARLLPDPTARLQFREMTEADLPEMAAMLGDAEVMRHYPRPRTREEALAWIRWNQDGYAEHGHGLWVVETHDGAFVGDCGLTWQQVGDERLLEVGWHVVPARQGEGLATEAARACLDLALAETGETHVVAIIVPGNVASRRVAEKIGMTVEREAVAHGRAVVVHGVGG